MTLEASRDTVQRSFKAMNIFGTDEVFSWRVLGKRTLACLLSLALLTAAAPLSLSAQDSPQDQDAQAAPPQDQGPPPGTQAPAYAQQTPEQLQRLVAPIALYPDSLVAQILAAATFPDEIVEADRWVQAHPELKGQALGDAVNQQPWDPSVKALTAFPSVLGNMDKNLSWTSTLGDAYYNQQQDVMDAVQVMRRKARDAGALKTTPQEVVKDDGPYIEVEPDHCLRSCLRSLAGLWISHRGLARLVSLPWNLVWRPVSVVWAGLRNRLVRRFRMGLGSLGIRLAQSLCHV
jgi:hypothetical protein